MTLAVIVMATLVAGIGSVWIAAWLARGVLARFAPDLLSLAAGALLATAFIRLLPEAFESGAEAQPLFLTLLLGLLFFFLLDKAELWHHGHEHHGPDPGHPAHHHHADHASDHHHTHRHGPGNTGSWAVLLGDSVHAFGDGILIAAAFVADMRLGAAAALAVLAHEVPHHIGDLVVLRQRSGSARSALIKVSLAGAITALGGVLGYLLVGQLHDYLPYFLTVASSSFIYVALADLIPQLQKHLNARQTLGQITWLACGIVMVLGLSGLAHGH